MQSLRSVASVPELSEVATDDRLAVGRSIGNSPVAGIAFDAEAIGTCGKSLLRWIADSTTEATECP